MGNALINSVEPPGNSPDKCGTSCGIVFEHRFSEKSKIYTENTCVFVIHTNYAKLNNYYNIVCTFVA